MTIDLTPGDVAEIVGLAVLAAILGWCWIVGGRIGNAAADAVGLSPKESAKPELVQPTLIDAPEKTIRQLLWELLCLLPGALRNLPRFLKWYLPRRWIIWRFNRLANVIVVLDWFADHLHLPIYGFIAWIMSWNLTHAPREVRGAWDKMWIESANEDGHTARIERVWLNSDGTTEGIVEVFPPDGEDYVEDLPASNKPRKLGSRYYWV